MAKALSPRRPAGPRPGLDPGLKARTDVVEALFRRGHLAPEEWEAARDIRRVWEALGRGLFPRPRSAECLDLSAWLPEAPARAPFRDPFGRMSGREERAWRVRYRPWAKEMAAPVARGSRVSRSELTIDIVVANLRPRRAEEVHRLGHGAALPALRAALSRYAEIAGWLGPRRGRPADARRRTESAFCAALEDSP
ncbi:MAG: hypothetical protein HY521_15085 [Proteobacteria bacterium]|nr:hypothetical protein [Pseudomonadota bacterium]